MILTLRKSAQSVDKEEDYPQIAQSDADCMKGALRRRLATELARPARAFGGRSYYTL